MAFRRETADAGQRGEPVGNGLRAVPGSRLRWRDGHPGGTAQRLGGRPLPPARTPAHRRTRPSDHARTVASLEPETAYLPSGVTATQVTCPLWPENFRSSLPLSTSHTRTKLSSPQPVV